MLLLLGLILASYAASVAGAVVTSFLVDLGHSPSPAILALGPVVTRVISERSTASVIVNSSGLICAGAASTSTAATATSTPPFDYTILLHINASSLGPEAFAITECTGAAGAVGGVLIEGGDPLGVLYGIGQFLHTSTFDDSGVVPSTWRGTSAPQAPGSMRAAYLATHFMNFFQAAPPAKVAAYVEDLGLWGLNTLLVTIPLQQFTGIEDPSLTTLIALLQSIFASAKGVGIEVGLLHVPNQGFSTRPANIAYTPFPDPDRVRGNLGFLTCAHSGQGYLENASSAIFSNFSALDTLLFWPYDEGGCGCETDWPWGARGFPSISSTVLANARLQFPGLKAVLSTWMFDQPLAGEFDGLDIYLRHNTTPATAINAIMADNHADFPAWPLEHNGAPGGLPLYNFPEISMWGRSPWGGFGANPLPARFQHLWNETKGLVTGGAPYSEGIYNDINMVIALRHYWDAGASSSATVTAYASFEFGALAAVPVASVMATLENNWQSPVSSALNVSAALEAVDVGMSDKLKVSWRWRQLLLRGRLDAQLFIDHGRVNCSNALMVAAFKELALIYYASQAEPRVRPPCT